MLATHTVSLPSSPTPTTRPFSLSTPRPALADSTNVGSRSNACDAGCPKSLAFPTSAARTSCSWSNLESSIGSISTPFHPRYHHLMTTPSLFPVTYKAPPTLSISLSAACSHSIPAERSRVQGSGPDLPDVRSVVPFPSTPLDTDVVMLDATCAPCPDTQTPRKRRSAHSTVSLLQNSPCKDAKQKRPRKSKRQVVELWWLGVVHRSILRCIEDRQPVRELDSSDGSLRDFNTMDRALVEKIQKRLAENGCVDGRTLPTPLPRPSPPSISVPYLSATSRKALSIDSAPSRPSAEPNVKGNNILHGTVTSLKASPCCSLSIPSRPPISSSTSTSHRRHVHFDNPQQPRQPRPHASIPRRSPSPPARTGAVYANLNAQTLSLTMPQLVASLMLAYREKNSLRVRGRSDRVTDCGKNAGRSLPSSSCQASDAIHDKERTLRSITPRARLLRAPERRSPLYCVTYAES